MKRKTRLRKRGKSSRAKQIRVLDELTSLYVRLHAKRHNGGKSFFSDKPAECCFHVITRGKHSVRWDLRNVVASTKGENFEMEFNPHPYVAKYIAVHGLEAYETLVRDSNRIAKHSMDDLRAIEANLRLLLEKVCVEAPLTNLVNTLEAAQ